MKSKDEPFNMNELPEYLFVCVTEHGQRVVRRCRVIGTHYPTPSASTLYIRVRIAPLRSHDFKADCLNKSRIFTSKARCSTAERKRIANKTVN